MVIMYNDQGCSENWPLWSEIEVRLTPGEMAQLGTSLSKYQVNSLSQRANSSVTLYIQSNFRELKFSAARGFCVEYLRKLDDLKILMPHRNYEIASMALSSCYWATLQ